jgi:hypothetical protein
MSATPGTAASLVATLDPWLDRLFPDPPRGRRLREALAARFGADERALDAVVCAEVEAVAQGFSRHLELHFAADGSLAPDEEPPGWPEPDAAAVRERAGSVREVSRREDGVGVLVLAGLDAAPLAEPYLEAAFSLLRGSRAVVLDLRDNGGGDPATLALVLDWLLGPGPRHLSDVHYRDRVREWWTAGRAAERALAAGTPVAALISARTFSSGEALAYHFRSQGRGRLVGEATPGAADHVTPVRVSPHVRAVLPEAYVRDAVTGTNWEGAGVQPDVACGADEALDVAVRLLVG